MKKVILILALVLIIPLQFSYSQDNDESENKDNIEVKKNPILTSKIYFNGGLFLPSKSIKASLNGSSENDIIDFNDAFNFNQKETTFAANFIWRFAKKWHLGAEYFGVKNSGSWAIEEEIEWEDVTYGVGATLDAGFRINMYRIFIGRVISSGQQHELGGGLGVHAMDIRTYIEGNGFVDGSSVISYERRTLDLTAPLPNIGFWYYYTPTEKWALTARVDWFGITVGDYSGSLWNIAPGVKYQILDNLGVGLNYRYFKTNLTVNKDNLNASLDLIFHGPLFTVSGNF